MTEQAVVDRRVLRGQRNRDAVVTAFLDLVTEGDLSPTAQRVAERAGVSMRSVFHHFNDMEQLFASAADLNAERYAPLWRAAPLTGSVASRVEAVVAQRAALVETVLPVYRASTLVAPRSATVAGRLAWADERLRERLAEVFAGELRDGPPELLDALDAAASLDAWVRLRVRQALTAEEAAAVVRTTLGALLGASGPQ